MARVCSRFGTFPAPGLAPVSVPILVPEDVAACTLTPEEVLVTTSPVLARGAAYTFPFEQYIITVNTLLLLYKPCQRSKDMCCIST